MIVKKLTIPFIQENILKRTQNCFIASATISEAGFNFIHERLPKTCKCHLLTGLHLPTPPKLLRRILELNKADIEMKIFSQNFFHPKVYIFETSKEAFGFIGSGNLTMGGFSKNEELAYMIQNTKQLKELKEWFGDYFRKAKPLTMKIIAEYEKIYPLLKEKEAEAKKEIKKMSDFISGSFNWDNFDLSNQYFARNDYLTFENAKASLITPEVTKERLIVHRKILQLHDEIKNDVHRKLNLHEHFLATNIASGTDPVYQPDNKVKGMWLAYGRNKPELFRYKRGKQNPKHMNFIRLQFIIQEQVCGIWLMPGKKGGGEEDRAYFKHQMTRPSYRKQFFKLLNKLPHEYWIEVAEDLKYISEFSDENSLWEYTKEDDWVNYYFTIGRDYSPDDPAISSVNISNTILTEFERLNPLYRHMKDKSFE